MYIVQNMKYILVVRNVMLCSYVEIYQLFMEPTASIFCSKNGGSKF